eukprot:2410270-Rhodomonas_salina.2
MAAENFGSIVCSQTEGAPEHWKNASILPQSAEHPSPLSTFPSSHSSSPSTTPSPQTACTAITTNLVKWSTWAVIVPPLTVPPTDSQRPVASFSQYASAVLPEGRSDSVKLRVSATGDAN